MVEVILAVQWVGSVLKADAAIMAGLSGGIHQIPPLGTASPFGIVREETQAEDVTGLNNGTLIWVPVIVQVNFYDREQHSYERVGPIAERAYALLQAAQALYAGGVIFSCRRLSTIARPDPIGATQEWHIDQRFQLEVRSN